MSRAPSRKKWWILGGIAALFGLALIVPEIARAGFVEDTLSGFVTSLFRIVGYILNVAGGLFFWLASQFTQVILDLNLNVLTNQNVIVTVGWNITRDVANLGFVLFLIIIALATIVRYREYEASRLLPKLIAAAILVNFSLAIAGIFVDFSNMLTKSFLGDSSDTTTLVNAAVNAFNPQRLFLEGDPDYPQPTNPAEEASALRVFGEGVITSIVGLLFSVIFTWLAVLVMACLGIMLFLRYLHLTFLFVIAPIAWLFWIFPGLSGNYSKWWSSFLKWIFFAPAASFFIYLATLAVAQMGRMQFIRTGTGISGFLQTLASQGVQMFVLGGLMLGGLIVAQSMGIGFASTGLKIAGSMKGAALKVAGNQAKLARRALAQKTDRALKGTIQEKEGQGVRNVLRKGTNFIGTKASKGFSWAKKGDEFLEVKETDKGAKRIAKRLAGGVLGVTGGRAVLKAAGEAPKTITTAAGRDIKRESIPGTLFEGFRDGVGLGKKEKEEKTTDDHKKELVRLTKEYADLKKKGVIKDGDELDKKWKLNLARAESQFNTSLEKTPNTVAELGEYMQRMNEGATKSTGEHERGVQEIYRRRIEEAKDKQLRLIAEKERRSAGIGGSLDDLIEKTMDSRYRILNSITDEMGEEEKKDIKKVAEALQYKTNQYEELRRRVAQIDAQYGKKEHKDQRKAELIKLFKDRPLPSDSTKMWGSDEKELGEAFANETSNIIGSLKTVSTKPYTKKELGEDGKYKDVTYNVWEELERAKFNTSFERSGQYFNESEDEGSEKKEESEKKKEGPKVRGYQGEGDFKDAENNRKDRKDS